MTISLLAAFQRVDVPGGQAVDSVVVESPLPGGVATVIRFLFQAVPQWFQVVGFLIGVLIALALLVYVLTKYREIGQWVRTRSWALQVGLLLVAVVLVGTAAWAGKVSWDYMQHDNSFCTGCHVMEPAFTRFSESEHDTLSCHDCHQQSIYASMRQLYLWVAERPEEIRDHSPVPNAVCENCHVTGEPEVWQRVASTAGHRTHLESDSVALRDILCVSCHGLELHRFVPVDSTCSQADCHVDVDITIGKMQNQTTLHCVTCHQYTVEVPALATRDSAAGTLVPGESACFSCHEMEAILADFDPVFDPHSGTCGMCHNPHQQEVAADADATCATAQCHVDWRDEPFHVGTQHVDVGRACTLCHEPHRARVDASDCQACHLRIADDQRAPRAVRQRLRRIAPFDTAQALRQTSLPPPHRPFPASAPVDPERPRGKGDVLPPTGPREAQASITLQATPPDSFSHDQHADLACLTCHETRTGHGALTFEQPRGCQICHHQAPITADCSSCHTEEELRAPLATTVSVTVEDYPARERQVGFVHDQHTELRCVECHTEPVSLVTTSAVATCTDCHDDHHTASRDCISCHTPLPADTLHAPPAEAHEACDACHTVDTVARLLPDSPFCLTCHAEAGDHYPDRTCSGCHLNSTPEDFRHRLVRQPVAP